MKIVILEDEDFVAKRLIKLLEKLTSQFSLLAVLGRVSDAIDWFENNEHPDVIFSDIQLADGNSFSIFDKIKTNVPIIFTTSYDEFALKAFQVNSIDYLLKPITEKKLKRSLQRLKNFKPEIQHDNISSLLRSFTEKKSYRERFLLKSGLNFITLSINEIAYFFVEDRVTYAQRKNARPIAVDKALEELANELDPKLFFKINRQMIIGYDSIKQVKTFFNSRLLIEVEPKFKEDVLVTRSNIQEFKAWLDQ